MTVTDNTYIDSMFFVGNGAQDWMATVYREDDGPWEIEYRFRYYAQDTEGNTGDPHDGKDKKNFYHLQAPDNSEQSLTEAINALTSLAQMISAKWGGEMHVTPVKGGSDALMAVLKDQPWAHMRTVDTEAGMDIRVGPSALTTVSAWDQP